MASKAGVGLAVGAGVVVAAGLVALAARQPSAAAVSPMPPTPSPGTPSAAPGLSTQNPTAPNPLTATPATASGAPGVGNFSATRNADGSVTVAWSGTLQANWNGANSIGYDLFLLQKGAWMPVQAEVEPPLRVSGLPAGSTIGVAPIYQNPDGSVVAGAISSATV